MTLAHLGEGAVGLPLRHDVGRCLKRLRADRVRAERGAAEPERVLVPNGHVAQVDEQGQDGLVWTLGGERVLARDQGARGAGPVGEGDVGERRVRDVARPARSARGVKACAAARRAGGVVVPASAGHSVLVAAAAVEVSSAKLGEAEELQVAILHLYTDAKYLLAV